MTIKRGRFAAAVTLVEVMVAVLISTIVILGSSFFFVASSNQVNLQEQYRAASGLASQTLEELKAGSYDDIATSETAESLSLEETSYSRSIDSEDLGLYKKVTVTVNWDAGSKQRNVSLATLIAPK